VERKILRLLIIDDSPDDAEGTVTAVRKGGYMLKSQRVQDLASMQAALDKGTWDLVLAEFNMPHFGARMALDLLKRADLDLPLIVMTRDIRDEDLVQIMRAGARDVVLKSQATRLAPAIRRELQAVDDRHALQIAQAKLGELVQQHRAVIEGTREALCYSQDGMHVNANKAYLALFGYSEASELEGVPVMNLIDKVDHARYKEMLRKNMKDGAVTAQEFMGVRKDDSRFAIEVALSTIELDGEPCTQMVVTDISKRKAAESKLQYMSQHDPLTGLFNRHHFLQEAAKTVDSARKGKVAATLLYIDLHQLKRINDTLGYAAGDRLLIRVTKLFRERMGDDAIVARYGGDEFVALLPNKSTAEVKERIDALHKALRDASFAEGGKSYQCACTLGTAPIDRNTESAQKAIAEAYQASQKDRPAAAPEGPGARPIIAASVEQEVSAPAKPQPTAAQPPQTPAVDAPRAAQSSPASRPQSATAPVKWVEQIRHALAHDGFTLAYQPVVNLHGDPAEFFEVLVRMQGPDGKLVNAGQFIPTAEHAGLSTEIDRWVARVAVEGLATLHQEGRQATFFVNISPPAFVDKELITGTAQALFAAGIKAKYLIFEIDEAAIAKSPTAAAGFLRSAKKIGCGVSIDNFGRDPRALEALQDIKIDFAKIDGSFIRNLAGDNVSEAALRALVEVAKSFDILTVAKSVEKAENLAELWRYSVDYVMGNYFQEADASTSYDFGGETELSSDTITAPSWAAR
jgi:diguanylate cyclase (GGDEF)-like protein/PAS domain S-box-containing protein